MRRLATAALLLALALPWVAHAAPPESDLCLQSEGESSSDVSLHCRPSRVSQPIAFQPIAFATGCYTGNGSDNRNIVSGITQPGLLIISRKTTGVSSTSTIWTPEIAGGGDRACHLGNSSPQCEANLIQTASPLGSFQVGTDTHVNGNGNDYCWYQWGLSSQHGTFTYTGNGSSPRTIALGTMPDFVGILLPTGNTYGGNIYARIAGMPAGISYGWYLVSEVAPTDLITVLASSGVTVSTNANNNASVFYGWWWKNGAQTGVASWVGAAGTNGGTCSTAGETQTITAPCSPPRNAFVLPCTAAGCEGKLCNNTAAATHAVAANRGTNIGQAVVGPGNLTSSDFYAQWDRQPDLGLGSMIGVFTSSTFDIRASIGGGAPSLNDLGETNRAYVTCGTAPSIGTVNAADWTFGANAIVSYELEETTGATRVNVSPFICTGTTCNLADSNSVVRDTTNKVVGSASANFTAASSQVLACTLSTCTALNLTFQDFSWGCFAWTSDDSANKRVMVKANSDYGLFRNAATDALGCQVVLASSTSKFGDAAGSSWPADGTKHAFGCVLDSAGQTLQAYVDGAASGSAGTSVASIRDSSGTNPQFVIGRDGASGFYTGNADECYVYKKKLAATDECRICSCGLNGTLCSCFAGDTTLYVNYGRNSSCGNCALPACDASAP